MIDAAKIEEKIEKALNTNNIKILDRLFDEMYEKSAHGEKPYEAAIALKADYNSALVDAANESNIITNWANRIARAKRLIQYRLKTAGNFTGHRIVDEGDSWFQYPFLLDDIVDNFNKEDDFAVFSLSAGGDLIEHIAVHREYDEALSETAANVLLLSGGGNDLLGNGRFSQLLNPYKPDTSPLDMINQQILELVSDRIIGYYRQICSDVYRNHPHVTIFVHGYDTPLPMHGGEYFGKPLEDAGIPLEVGRQIIELIVTYFKSRLSILTEDYSNYKFVDLTGTVGSHLKSWEDELHPDNAGFRRAAVPLITAVKEHLSNLPENNVVYRNKGKSALQKVGKRWPARCSQPNTRLH